MVGNRSVLDKGDVSVAIGRSTNRVPRCIAECEGGGLPKCERVEIHLGCAQRRIESDVPCDIGTLDGESGRTV